jgi:hypothetical protein
MAVPTRIGFTAKCVATNKEMRHLAQRYDRFNLYSSLSRRADLEVTVSGRCSPVIAVLAEIDTNWRVIGSTSSVAAKLHTDTDDSPLGPTGVPIYRLDGLRIASDYDDLWDGYIQRA